MRLTLIGHHFDLDSCMAYDRFLIAITAALIVVEVEADLENILQEQNRALGFTNLKKKINNKPRAHS